MRSSYKARQIKRHRATAEYINELTVPAYIYHCGDFDPSGVNAGEKIETTLMEMAPDAEIYFKRIAVTPEQINFWELPTRPTKTTDTRAKGFGDISVELDAIAPNQLRALVAEAIEQHLPKRQFKVLKAPRRASVTSSAVLSASRPAASAARTRHEQPLARRVL